jgi:CheY-like chemotaxis protein
LPHLLDGALSHDRIQRFLASPMKSGKDLWKVVKPYLRQIQADDGVLIVDDSISEKPHTDENEIICWHYDHSSGQLVKGINFITALYHVDDVSLPVNYHLVEKTELYIDEETGKQKRRATMTKNEVYRQMLKQVIANQIPFRYVLNDVWYASADNMMFVKHDLKREFIMPLKMADPTGIHQIMMNLGTNAVQAMPGGGVLEIGLEPLYLQDSMARAHPGLREGHYALLKIRDTGVGMDQNVLARAFEPFYTTKQAGSGTGLGLAIVRGIVLDHEGTVELESEPGRGTTVTCLFPTLEAGEEVTQPRTAPMPTGSGQRILFVDDEHALSRAAERNLRELGYQPTVASDGLAVLDMLRQTPTAFDLLVTDFSMPMMNGLELARQVHEIRPDLPIILATGFIEDLAPEELASAGIRRTLRKPVTKRELGEAIHAAIAAN